MDNSYKKYLKYKIKYLELKSQIGGNYNMLQNTTIGNIHNNLFNHTCIESYISNKGWSSIVESYKSKKNITFDNDYKNCNVSSDKVPGILFNLVGLRLYIINSVLENTKNKFKKYKDTISINAPGSTNLTSDYDFTVAGKISSKFIWEFLKLFVNSYHLPPSISLDSNAYPASSSYNTKKGTMNDIESKKGIAIITIANIEYVLYLGGGEEDINSIHDLMWTFAKLYKYINDKEKKNMTELMKFLLKKGKIINDLCDKSFCKNNIQIDEVNNLVLKIHEDKQEQSKIILNNYFYLYKLGEPLDELYSKDIPISLNNLYGTDKLLDQDLHPYINSVLGYSSLIKWLCSEAYYSNFTVYASVISLQLGYDDKCIFPKILWITAAIENLADLLLHMTRELKDLKDNVINTQHIYIRYSKYVYRIVYCLEKLAYFKICNSSSFSQKTSNYIGAWKTLKSGNMLPHSISDLKKVLPLRKTFNLEKANEIGAWTILQPNEHTKVIFTKDGINEWLTSMKKNYMPIFQEELEELYPNINIFKNKITENESIKIIKLENKIKTL